MQLSQEKASEEQSSHGQLSPKRYRLSPKPTWRKRRRLRTTSEYRLLQRRLGISDAETLLLLRVGELHTVEAGQQIPREVWSQSHIVIGLSTRLAVGAFTEVTAPWRIDDPGPGAEISAVQPGVVVLIDRRHLHLVESTLAGRVEPVAPIAKAVKYPVPHRRNQGTLSGTKGQSERTPADQLVRAMLGADSS